MIFQVCKQIMGLLAKPSMDVKEIAMLSGMRSLPVTYFKKVPSAGKSNKRMNLCK